MGTTDGTTLGDRQKAYEMQECGRKPLARLPIMIRLDGRNFSTWTRGMRRPYDPDLTNLMRDTTKFLVEELHADLGYTQSDEISLVILQPTYDTKLIFDSRIQKLVSISASLCTAYFNDHARRLFPLRKAKLATFDSRVWPVPSLDEATNAILWRERDASKNAVTMAARTVFSDKEIHKKNSIQKIIMMHDKGVNFSEYPASFRQGSFVRRVTTTVPFTRQQEDALPAKHKARKDPNLHVTRSRVEFFDVPELVTVKNRTEVLFYGAEAIHV